VGAAAVVADEVAVVAGFRAENPAVAADWRAVALAIQHAVAAPTDFDIAAGAAAVAARCIPVVARFAGFDDAVTANRTLAPIIRWIGNQALVAEAVAILARSTWERTQARQFAEGVAIGPDLSTDETLLLGPELVAIREGLDRRPARCHCHENQCLEESHSTSEVGFLLGAIVTPRGAHARWWSPRPSSTCCEGGCLQSE
jgi:hypothetical protein